MSFVTPNMGLTAWDVGSDPYDHDQLADNWAAIDQHNHALGHGVQIPTAGIEDSAVTTPKINNLAVTTPKLGNQSVTQQKMADNSVGSAQIIDGEVHTQDVADQAITQRKLDPTVLPVGSVIAWYRPNGTISPPLNWEICDGRSWNTIPNEWGITTGNIPDLRNKFILGASLTGIGTDPSSPPDIGAAGGSHTRSLTHTHTINSHSHPHSHVVDAHSHFMDHYHHGAAHTHSIDGTSQVFDYAGVGGAFGVLPGSTNTGTSGTTSTGGPLEGGDSPRTSTDQQSPGTTTDNTGSGTLTSNNNSALGSDFRPSYVGLLYIMKVKST